MTTNRIETDIAPILQMALGQEFKDIPVTELEGVSYPIETDYARNWSVAAIKGFDVFSKKNPQVKSLAIIGGGMGQDGVGAVHAFPKLEKLVTVDLDEQVKDIALDNIRRYTDIEVISRSGNLCEPLGDEKYDVIYQHLPRIPQDGFVLDGISGASLFNPTQVGTNRMRVESDLAKMLKSYLLELQFLGLVKARKNLNEDGSVLYISGGRAPDKVVGDMIAHAGYKHERLVSSLKKQCQPETVFEGYSAAEKNWGIKFNYYDSELAEKILTAHGIKEPYLGIRLPPELLAQSVSATHAKEHYKRGREFRHYVSVLALKDTQNI